MRILVADDEQVVLQFISIVLQEEGFDVIQAHTGDEAWEILQGDDPPRIAILDWRMPGRSGVDICRDLTIRDDAPLIYRIIVSGFAIGEDDADTARYEGAHDYLRKPLKKHELLSRVHVAQRLIRADNSIRLYQKMLQDRFDTKSTTLQSILDHTSVIIVQFSLDGYIVFANRYCSDFFASQSNMVLGGSFYDLLTDTQAEEFRRRIAFLSPELPTFEYTCEILGMDHRFHSIRWECRGIFDESGTLLHVHAGGHDVTQPSEPSGTTGTASIIGSDDLFHHLTDHSSSAIFVTRDGRITYANATFCDLVESTTDDLGGKQISEVLTEKSTSLLEQCGVDNDEGYELPLESLSGKTWDALVAKRSVTDQGLPAVAFSLHDISTRKKLRNELSRNQYIMDCDQSIILLCDEDARILYANQSAIDSLHIDRINLLGSSLLNIDSRLTSEKWAEQWEWLCEEKHLNTETEFVRTDRSTFMAGVNSHLVTWDGKSYCCLFARDITTDQQLELSLNRFRAATEYSPLEVFFLNDNGWLIYANQTIRRRMNIESEKPSVTIFDINVEMTPQRWRELLKDMEEQGRVMAWQTSHRDSQGLAYPVLINAHLIESNGEKLILAIAHDITPQLQFETALSEANAKLKIYTSQLENLHEDNRTRLEEKDSTLLETMGQLEATQQLLALNDKITTLGHLTAGIAHEINSPLGAISSASNELKHAVETLLAFDNLPPQIGTDIKPVIDFFSDIKPEITSNWSTRERRQKRLEMSKKLEQQGFTDTDSLARTLIELGLFDAIDKHLDLLRDAQASDLLKSATNLANLKRSTQIIQLASDKVAQTVSALKSFMHNSFSEKKIKTNVEQSIETVLTLFYNQIKQGVELVKNFEHVPQIACYPDEICQIWSNLINNAIQAMDHGGKLTISLWSEGDAVSVSVTDNGCGIPEEIQGRIFDPFFTTKEVGEGTGLGLDIVRKIVEHHNGSLDYRSCCDPDSLQRGTTFQVTLPLK